MLFGKKLVAVLLPELKTIGALVARQHDASLAELRAKLNEREKQLGIAQVRIVALERQLATSQANVDWLRVFANNLSNDRAAIAATKGLALPVPQLEGDLTTPQQVQAAAVNAPVTSGAGFVDVPDDLDGAMEQYRGVVDNFEDVGDDRAKEMGIAHADDGTVEYRR